MAGIDRSYDDRAALPTLRPSPRLAPGTTTKKEKTLEYASPYSEWSAPMRLCRGILDPKFSNRESWCDARLAIKGRSERRLSALGSDVKTVLYQPLATAAAPAGWTCGYGFPEFAQWCGAHQPGPLIGTPHAVPGRRLSMAICTSRADDPLRRCPL